MKKAITLFLAAVMSCVCLCACSGQQAALPSGVDVPPAGKSDPFGFQSNTVKPEVVIDGSDDDELWQGSDVAHISFSSCEVSVLRRATAIYVFFKVQDVTPYSYVSVGDADEVTFSDSIEFYLDAKMCREKTPQANCYQINLGRDSRTRIMSGSNGSWYLWDGMYTFETREGWEGDDYDYYYIEAMIPVAQMGIGATEDVGIAFGHVDRTVDDNRPLDAFFKWYGMDYKGTFIEPQSPSLYLVLRSTGGSLLTYAEYDQLKATTASKENV